MSVAISQHVNKVRHEAPWRRWRRLDYHRIRSSCSASVGAFIALYRVGLAKTRSAILHIARGIALNGVRTRRPVRLTNKFPCTTAMLNILLKSS